MLATAHESCCITDEQSTLLYLSTATAKGSSIKDVRAEGGGVMQKWTNAVTL